MNRFKNNSENFGGAVLLRIIGAGIVYNRRWPAPETLPFTMTISRITSCRISLMRMAMQLHGIIGVTPSKFRSIW